jgi:Spy/CpxP family protein refolding chaperone
MKTARTVLAITAALLIISPLWAADSKKKAPPCPAAERIKKMTAGLTLTDEQKAKLDETGKECDPKFVEMGKKLDVFTPEQKKARNEAIKAAKADGKQGKEFNAAVDAAVTLTDDQKATLADARKEMGSLEKELREKVMCVLTPAQQEQLKAAQPGKKKEAKAEKKAPPSPAAERIKRITAGLTLTDDQKAKLDATGKECDPEFVEMGKKWDVFTPEQKKARNEAFKAAKAAGKTGKDLNAAADAAVTLTDDQKATLADARKEMGSLEKQLREKVMCVLTPAQKEQLKAAQPGKKKEAKDEKKAPPSPAAERIKRITKGLTLTGEQKAKLDATAKECDPKFVAMGKKLDVFTPEQKKARNEAAKAAKADGKTGKELNAAVDAAVTLTDDQKDTLADARKEMGSLEKEFREKVMGVLTPEQQEQVKAAQPGKKKAVKDEKK